MYNITGIYPAPLQRSGIYALILYFFCQVQKNLIVHALYPLANFIISLDIGGPNIKKKTIGKQSSSSHIDPLKEPTLEPNLPAAVKPAPYPKSLSIRFDSAHPIAKWNKLINLATSLNNPLNSTPSKQRVYPKGSSVIWSCRSTS